MKKERILTGADKGKFLAIIIISIFTILFTGNTYSQKRKSDYKKIDEKSYEFKPGQRINVSSFIADVIIKPWNKNEFSIKVYSTKDIEDYIDISYRSTSYGVEVKADSRKRHYNGSYNLNMKFEISVPEKCDIVLNTVSGDMDIQGIDGKISLETASGDAELNDINGAISCTSASGDVAGNLSDCKIDIETASGDISIDYRGKNNGINLDTASGDIKLGIPSSFKADASFATASGDISTNIDGLKTRKHSKRRTLGEINGGGNKLNVSTASGDITVKER